MKCNHEWVVFSTVLSDVLLLVQCVGCGACGTVDDPSEDEWRAAFRAPSEPYRWNASGRVTVRGILPPDKWYVTNGSGTTGGDTT